MRERVRIRSSQRRMRVMGAGVLMARNAVHSVLRRVGVFGVAGVYRLVGREREYMGRRYRRVYVGAIAVLLRFVVMRLQVTEWEEVGKSYEESEMAVQHRGGGVGMGRMGRRLLREDDLSGVEGGRGNRTRTQDWREYSRWNSRRDNLGRIQGMGQYRYTEGRKRVWMVGGVRRVARRGAVVLTGVWSGRPQDGKTVRVKSQKVGQQRARQGSRGTHRGKRSEGR